MSGRPRGTGGHSCPPTAAGERRSEFTATTITKAERRRLKEAAKRRGYSVAYVLRLALIEYLDKRDIPDPQPELVQQQQLALDDGRAA